MRKLTTIKFILPSILILIFTLSFFNVIGQCTITQDASSASLSAGIFQGAGESFTACQAGNISKVCFYGGQHDPTQVRIIDNDDPAHPIVIYDNASPVFQTDGSFKCHTVTSTVAITNGVMFDYPTGGPGWGFTSSGNAYSGSIFIKSNGTWSLTGSLDLAFEVGIVSAALPVELTDFQATLTEEYTTFLSWETASEENNAGFEIQRSANGKDWEMVHFVEGNGTTLEVQNYTYTDEQPIEGVNYYRLKQIDFDNQFEYSKIVNITMKQ